MAQDPNAPTAPVGLAGDPGTGPGDGLDNAAATAPEAPALDGADPAGTSEAPPFTEEEIQKESSPDVQARMQGMLKSWTQAQQRVKAKERDLDQRLATVSEMLERERASRAEAPRDTEAATAPNPDDELEELYKRVDPAAAETLKRLEKGILAKVSKLTAPVAAGAASARATAELTAMQSRYPDFGKVVNIPAVQNALARNPNLNLEDIYRIEKYNMLTREVTQLRGELGKQQMRAKQAAVTERPSGPAYRDLSTANYEKVPLEKRLRMSMSELAELTSQGEPRA